MPSKGEKRREQQRRQYRNNLGRFERRRRERREWWIELKGSLACKACGNNDWRCLDFHHRDPSTKVFAIGACTVIYSKKVILEEMEKCDVLCANCHRIHHWEERRKTKTTH